MYKRPIGLIAAMMCAGTALAQSDMTVEGAWSVVPSPNAPPEPLGNTLLDVAAISPTDVWTVGYHHNPEYCTFCPAPLAMHWNGAQWSIIDTPTIAEPKVQFRSVAAICSDDVWAVGHWLNDTALEAGTLIEHWNGTSWSVVASPSPGMFSALYGVAAAASDDVWAVGDKWLSWSTKVPLILHYNGKQWSEVATPPIEYGELASVFALSHDDVWAVGVQGVVSTGIQALALHWDGTSWSEVPFPTDGDGYIALYSVAGAASNDVWAVGVFKYLNLQGHYLSSARAYHWDGSSWTKELFPGIGGTDSRFYDVHVNASDDSWAVGGQPVLGDPNIAFEYVTVHWDGTSWSESTTPAEGVLYAVGASSNIDAWAVGFGMDELAYSTGTYTIHYTIPCLGDLVSSGSFQPPGDGAVDAADLAFLLGEWGENAGSTADFVTTETFEVPPDGYVNAADLAFLLGAWGQCK